MSFKIYSLFDEKSGKFNPLQLMYTHEDAKRSILEIISSQPMSLVCKFPGDFKLYCVGEFDDCTGIIKHYDVPELVAPVSEIVNV